MYCIVPFFTCSSYPIHIRANLKRQWTICIWRIRIVYIKTMKIPLRSTNLDAFLVNLISWCAMKWLQFRVQCARPSKTEQNKTTTKLYKTKTGEGKKNMPYEVFMNDTFGAANESHKTGHRNTFFFPPRKTIKPHNGWSIGQKLVSN